MAVPAKYRELGDFHEYYSGHRKAPYLTIFIGGNHEASNHLFELYYGGWVAPNIYYMGAANVLRLGPLRIAALSGIWKGYNFRKRHHERLPYNQDDIRSIYHVRELDTRKLLNLSSQVDIGLSHDWPNGVEWKGDYKTLFRKKDLFEADARQGKLGSVAAKMVLDHLRPPYWFSAHLHVRYSAEIDHRKENGHAKLQNGTASDAESTSTKTPALQNAEEIDLDMDDDDPSNEPAQSEPATNPDQIDIDGDTDQDKAPSEALPASYVSEELRAQLPSSFAKKEEPQLTTTITNSVTRFLALDKCLPRRDFLQLLFIPQFSHNDQPDPDGSLNDGERSDPSSEPSSPRLCYDPEWLAITRVFAPELHLGDLDAPSSRDLGRPHYQSLIEKEKIWVDENIVKPRKLAVPENFTHTAPTQQEYLSEPKCSGKFTLLCPGLGEMPREYSNPQTEAFCKLLHLADPFKSTEEEILQRMQTGPRQSEWRGGGRGRGNRGSRGQGFRGGRGFGGRGRGAGRVGRW